MANIAIAIIDENGKILKRSKLNFAVFNKELSKIENFKSKYPLLSYIDPYGDTYFNRLQLPDLIDELKQLGSEQVIDQLIAFIKQINEPHRYLKFFGD